MLNQDEFYICASNQTKAKEIFNLDIPEIIEALCYIPMKFNDKSENASYDPGAETTFIRSSFCRESSQGWELDHW